MAKHRVPRTRNMGTQTEAAFFGSIRSALRKLSMYWKPKTESKRRAKVSRGMYRCARCNGVFHTKQVQVDHKEPCGSLMEYDDLPGFVERLFAEDVDAYECLCKPCHQEKSNAENAERRRQRKQ